jgi:hypothetical protein
MPCTESGANLNLTGYPRKIAGTTGEIHFVNLYTLKYGNGWVQV